MSMIANADDDDLQCQVGLKVNIKVASERDYDDDTFSSIG